MSERVFDEFEDEDLGEEAIIGGIGMHQSLALPSDFTPQKNLIIPSIPESVENFKDWLGDSPLVIEIGSGKGRFLNALAAKRPDHRFLGFETRLGLCGSVLARAEKAQLDNVAMACGDARFNIPLLVPEHRAIEAYLLFPDPWWKRRHARRRHGAVMAQTISKALVPGGMLVIKSDIPEYLESMEAAFQGTGLWTKTDPPDDLPLTDRQSRISFQGTNSFTVAFINS